MIDYQINFNIPLKALPYEGFRKTNKENKKRNEGAITIISTEMLGQPQQSKDKTSANKNTR